MSNARNLARLLPNTSGQLPDAAMSSGSVLQVVNITNGTGTSTSSATYVDTGLAATITPMFSSSKILIMANIADPFKSTGSVHNAMDCILVRDNLSIIDFAKANGYTGTDMQNNGFSLCCNFQDTPNTTSPVTYKVQYRRYGAANGGVVGINVSNGVSQMTLMEIAA